MSFQIKSFVLVREQLTHMNDQEHNKDDIWLRSEMVEQVLERTWWEGLKGNPREQGLPSVVQTRLENIYRQGIDNLCWKFIPV